MTKDTCDSLLKDVEDAILATRKTSAQYRRIKRFNVLAFGDSKKLITRGEPVKYYLPMEDIFDVIGSSHIAVGHGGRDRLKVETSRKAHHAGINMTPYKAMYGIDPRVGLSISNLPDDFINIVNDEDDLENLTGTQTGREYSDRAVSCRSEFITCEEKLFSEIQVPSNHISLRAAVTKTLTGSVQGFMRSHMRQSRLTGLALLNAHRAINVFVEK
ncbi:Hypothetical protein CINCED_3A012725 [Cinara cedri]|uniref:Uncharacterized protein n=1 Tax=Cinara cedri TaxID=506608 RepID=A0A5E4ML80_9HEMI|nr:Hypothetical protein CINCED_3A012725 [Cinara cedri]